jgi:hypothetical protein
LVSQLCGLERRTARSGKDSIDHAPNMHDDVANAVAGAVVSALGHQSVVVTPDLLARVSQMSIRRPAFANRRGMFLPPADRQSMPLSALPPDKRGFS